MSEVKKLAELCRSWGVPPAQADLMARQLAKRADQLMASRGLSREEVMTYLLRVVTQGRQGEVPKEFQSPPSAGSGSE
jgi:hypothetical protein